MRLGNLRIAAGALVVTAIAAPSVLTQLGGGGAASAAGITVSNTTNFDEIQYNQNTGNGANGVYYSFVPWSGSTAPGAGKTTTQSMTGGGGCSPGPNFPGLPPNPLLDITAQFFSQGYPNGAQAANVGAFKDRTGVCVGGNGNDQVLSANQALTIALGTDTAVTGANRIFQEGQIVLAREDKNTDIATVQLVESLAGSQVGTQQVQLSNNGTNVIADTSCGTGVANTEASFAPCTAGAAITTGFDQVQVILLGSATDQVSVVPTSIFYLANSICVGQPITTTSTDGTTTTGKVSATVALQGPAGTCKSYTGFSASANGTPVILPNQETSTKSVTFNSQELTGVHISVSIDWGTDPYCRPDNAGSSTGTPTCDPTFVSVLGGPLAPQVYCSSATTIFPLCTTSRTFGYVASSGGDPDNDGDSAFENDGGDGDGNTAVHITETWDGLNDWVLRN